MKPARLLSVLLPAVCVQLVTPASHAQRSNLSAREAIGMVSAQYGPQATAWIAEMRAQNGIPQPSDWQILTYEERAPRLLYRFWAGGGRVGDGGADEQRYPDDVPVGYFSPQQITVDSVAAFTIAEGAARQARMAFDSCDYLLRLREYSNEPVWRLELFDASRRIVGKLYISGGNGEILRTIWVYRDQRPDGRPTYVDSAAPGRSNAPVSLSETAYPQAPSGTAGMFPGAATVVPGSVSQVPGSMSGIHSVPLPPAPGVAVNTPAPYAPVSPSGRVMTPAPADPGIPSPPPIAPSAPIASAPSIPAPPAPSAAPAPAPAPAAPPASNKPPVSGSSGGDSERIPPPPIPR